MFNSHSSVFKVAERDKTRKEKPFDILLWFQFKIICESMKIIHSAHTVYYVSSIVSRHDIAYHVYFPCMYRIYHMINAEMRSIFLDPLASAILLCTAFFVCQRMYALGLFYWIALYSFVYTHKINMLCSFLASLYRSVAPSPLPTRSDIQWVFLMLLFFLDSFTFQSFAYFCFSLNHEIYFIN